MEEQFQELKTPGHPAGCTNEIFEKAEEQIRLLQTGSATFESSFNTFSQQLHETNRYLNTATI